MIYNVPPEIPLLDLKEGLMNSKGEEIPVLEAFRLGKPNEAGLVLSKSVLFILPLSTMVEKISSLASQSHLDHAKKSLYSAPNA